MVLVIQSTEYQNANQSKNVLDRVITLQYVVDIEFKWSIEEMRLIFVITRFKSVNIAILRIKLVSFAALSASRGIAPPP